LPIALKVHSGCIGSVVRSGGSMLAFSLFFLYDALGKSVTWFFDFYFHKLYTAIGRLSAKSTSKLSSVYTPSIIKAFVCIIAFILTNRVIFKVIEYGITNRIFGE
jgi:hypothetical protein